MPSFRVVLAIALLVPLAGCATRAQSDASPEVLEALADTRPMDWSTGNWWAYHATIQNISLDMALIVHEARPDAFRLGTNLSVGFFGLPWSGNVTHDLNPKIGPDVWQLYEFPLEEGKQWSYMMMGHEAKTVAHAALFQVPGVGILPGFRLESTAYGQTFARYNYVPEVGWFTRLQLIEPTDGHSVLDVELTSFGPAWDSAYFVEETLREIRVDYPASPGARAVEIPDGFLQIRAGLTSTSGSGVIDAQLKDEQGRLLAATRVLAKGSDSQRATIRPQGNVSWTLEHFGGGIGVVHLEVIGLSATGPLAAAQTPNVAIDMADLLQRTRPVWPQAGQTISTGLPVGV